MNSLGFVVIGRNEGDRLRACLDSIKDYAKTSVYVDSGSTDDSVHYAKSLGFYVVELDLDQPFTAARARNAGFDLINSKVSELDLVQFVDGDCIVFLDWINSAIDHLNSNEEIAIVCGRRRERFPDKSIYNFLCDIEWNTPVGEAKSCGGDFMIRKHVFADVNGFNPLLIAGEEPELCLRIRHTGWKIYRLDQDMTLHDADMHHFTQWWNRSKRAGYAFAEGAFMHGRSPERHWVKESARALVWGLVLPLAILFGALLKIEVLYLFLLYPLQVMRLHRKSPIEENKMHWVFFTILGKFPEVLGLIKFLSRLILQRRIQIIEYK